MTEPIEPSTSHAPTMIHPRREPFDHGLIPIPKLIFSDPTQSLLTLKQTLLASSSNNLISSATISDSLQISTEHAQLLLGTLSSVIHHENDVVVDGAECNVYDLILLLYIQSYKKLLPRSNKDPASVADVWPSTSAFDGYFSALSPLQVRAYAKFSFLSLQCM